MERSAIRDRPCHCSSHGHVASWAPDFAALHPSYELIEWPYIVVYKVDEDRGEVVILAVVHGAQDRTAD